MKPAPDRPASPVVRQESADMAANISIVMSEADWFKLCAQICRKRRKALGEKNRDYCKEFECEICPECADEAIVQAPQRYRTTPERAESYDRLPGVRP